MTSYITHTQYAGVTNTSFSGQQPIVYSDVSCGGTETNILECNKKLHGTFECSNNNVAGVMCSSGESHSY